MSRRLLTGQWAAALVLLLMALALSPPAQAAGKDRGPRVRLLEVADQGDRLSISFRVEKAFDERILEKLEAGLKVSFKHQVGVRRRRTWWFERGVAQKRVFTTAVKDALSGEYTLTRKVNGGIVETLTSGDLEEVKTFLAEVRDLEISLPDGLPRDRRSEVRVRSILETRFWLFFPYPHDTDWVSRPLPGPEEGSPVPDTPASEEPQPPAAGEGSGEGIGAG